MTISSTQSTTTPIASERDSDTAIVQRPSGAGLGFANGPVAEDFDDEPYGSLFDRREEGAQ